MISDGKSLVIAMITEKMHIAMVSKNVLRSLSAFI
jgi:hypothetical protein